MLCYAQKHQMETCMHLMGPNIGHNRAGIDMDLVTLSLWTGSITPRAGDRYPVGEDSVEFTRVRSTQHSILGMSDAWILAFFLENFT